MAQDYMLGIDIGTQSSRAALIDLTGVVIASSSKELELQTPHAGWAEQDPQIWWDTTAANIQSVLQQAGISPQPRCWAWASAARCMGRFRWVPTVNCCRTVSSYGATNAALAWWKSSSAPDAASAQLIIRLAPCRILVWFQGEVAAG